MRWIASITLLLALGCESDPEFVDPMDGRPTRPDRGEWIEVEPGGETRCARGDAYRYFVRGGDPSKVIIDFQGGGACWNEETCGFADSLFSDETGTVETFQQAIADGILGGIYSEDGAFSDYTIIHIPYCTGDIHWGNSTVDYTDALTIEHRGFVNATAALDWIYSRYPDPERVFVNGCSAGAYGAALHSAYIAQSYPDARIAVLADSGAGIITDDFLTQSLPNWNAEPALPPFIDGLQRPLSELTLPDLYVEIGGAFPQMRMAQTATQFDADQIFFYGAMGGDPFDWTPAFRASLSDIEASSPNFRAYVPPGSVHCAAIYPYFDEREVNGVAMSDWVEQLVEGEDAPETVACDGAACCMDPICDACLDGDPGAHCRFCETWPQAWAVASCE